MWLRAERQTGGRGRQGRAWVSPPGNLYASTLVRLRPSDPPPATLALVAAVALEEAVARATSPGAAVAQMAQRPADRRRQAVGHPARARRRRGGDRLRRQPGASSRPILDRAATSLAAHDVAGRSGRLRRDARRGVRPLARALAGRGDRRRPPPLGRPRASRRHRAHRRPARRTARSTACSTGSTATARSSCAWRTARARVIHAGDVFLL